MVHRHQGEKNEWDPGSQVSLSYALQAHYAALVVYYCVQDTSETDAHQTALEQL